MGWGVSALPLPAGFLQYGVEVGCGGRESLMVGAGLGSAARGQSLSTCLIHSRDTRGQGGQPLSHMVGTAWGGAGGPCRGSGQLGGLGEGMAEVEVGLFVHIPGN